MLECWKFRNFGANFGWKLSQAWNFERKFENLRPNFAIFGQFLQFSGHFEMAILAPIFPGISPNLTRWGQMIGKNCQNWRQKWRNFEPKPNFARFWAIFGPKWPHTVGNIDHFGLIKNTQKFWCKNKFSWVLKLNNLNFRAQKLKCMKNWAPKLEKMTKNSVKISENQLFWAGPNLNKIWILLWANNCQYFPLSTTENRKAWTN